MKFLRLAELYEQLDGTTKKLEKRDILAEFYKKCADTELYKAVVLSMGTVFPRGEQELGIAVGMIKKVIERVTGASNSEVVEKFKTTGDLGLAAEKLMEKRKQNSLARRELTIDHVFDNLRKLPTITGQGSQDKKIGLIAELLSAAGPKEARYIVRTALGQMRIGVAAGIVRDAIAKAFSQDAKEIDRIHDILGDFGKVAEMAKKDKLKAEMQVGIPLRVMLADRAADLKEAMEKFEKVAIETKYDGFRIQCHKNGNDVKVFSRRMENVTRQFPDIVAMVKEGVTARQCIIEGEALAIKAGRPQPFQTLSRRIQRKHDIERTVKEIPVQVNLFDLLYLDGVSYLNETFRERWNQLNKIISENKSFRLAEHLETEDFEKADKFYKKSLAAGQEGVIVKNLDAPYQPGKRVGYWLKVKSILDPLDLVVVGAEWGEGRKAKWFSSVILAARDKEKLVSTGRMASGFTEEQLEELTKTLKPLIISEEGKVVTVKPQVVLEIGYEELQKSPKYESGYAMRFPRLLNFRSDKSPEDCTALKEIEKIYNLQRGRK
ncbi:MAG: DNA ligase 1 [archaeon GW2011_AR5]|nr:MAG: DNA ligase 1 [archaeon GW2011_AR5]